MQPVYVYNENHVRGHVLVCLLAYHVEWYLQRRLAALLFEELDWESAWQQRETPVQQKARDLLGVDPSRFVVRNLTG